MKPIVFSQPGTTCHRIDDDLLTAGLGLDGLRHATAPGFANPALPTPLELRRRAIWSNWRGIADLAPGGGQALLYEDMPKVPGREVRAYATVAGARQPHRVLVQVPDTFDPQHPCIVVTASSGSRGIYGAIAVAGAWALPRGYAVVQTDKGTGTDYVDLDAGQGVRADGTLAALGSVDDLAFAPMVADDVRGIAVKHVHSRDNPEADWGQHLQQAAGFALKALESLFPGRRFDLDTSRIIAVGISNGGGAVLRAAEDASPWLDAVVAAEPNVVVDQGRALYDYCTEAAVWLPCALPALGLPPTPYATARGAALAEAGWVDGATDSARFHSAHAYLRHQGWTDAVLQAGATSVALDLWRTVAAAYASAYGRYGAGEHPCGYHYVAGGATHQQRATWWSDSSGIPPGAGVMLEEPGNDHSDDPAWPGLARLRALWTGNDLDAQRVHAGIDATHCSPPRAGLPVIVIHGLADGLIPPAFSSAPYVAQARQAGGLVRYWQVRHAQHFDALLGLPAYAGRHVPLLPYVHAALDAVVAHLDGRAGLPPDAVIPADPPAAGSALRWSHLRLPG